MVASQPNALISVAPAGEARGESETAKVEPGRSTALITDLRPGRYRVTAALDGYHTKTVEAEIKPGELASVALPLEPLTFEVAVETNVTSGTLMLSRPGEAPRVVAITNGRAVVPGVRPGEYTFRVSTTRPGFFPAEQSLKVTQGSTFVIRLKHDHAVYMHDRYELASVWSSDVPLRRRRVRPRARRRARRRAGWDSPRFSELLIAENRNGYNVAISSSGESAPTHSLFGTQVKRYPAVESPEEVTQDSEFAVQVSLTTGHKTPDVKVEAGKTTQEGQLLLDLPETPEQKPWVIDVVISAPDFNLRQGANTAVIKMLPGGDSSTAVFFLQAKPFDGAQRVSKMFVTLWHEGNLLAKLSREILVVNPSALPVEKDSEEQAIPPPTDGRLNLQQTQATPIGAQSRPRRRARPSKAGARPVSTHPPRNDEKPLDLKLGLDAPDLSLYILHNVDGNEPGKANFIVASPHLPPVSATLPHGPEVSAWLDSQYAKLSQLRGGRGAELATGPETDASRRELGRALMRGFGRELYLKFAPAIFKEAFWKLSDKLGPRFRSIQIYSDDPAMPWELMRPVSPDGGREREFLGVEFRVGRWHISQSTSQVERPPQVLSLDRLVVIAPSYKGARTLPGQQKELRALRRFRGYERLSGRLSSIRKLFSDVPQGIIHFAGHGAAGRKDFSYSIRLEDADLDLMMWRGMVSGWENNHPLLFFNACEVGQAARLTNFVEGWAPAVLDAGGSGYIGALWPVGDSGAAEFSTYFYGSLNKSLKDGPTSVSNVLRETRRKFLENGDFTFLAYVFYGDTNLYLFSEPRVTRRPRAPSGNRKYSPPRRRRAAGTAQARSRR